MNRFLAIAVQFIHACTSMSHQQRRPGRSATLRRGDSVHGEGVTLRVVSQPVPPGYRSPKIKKMISAIVTILTSVAARPFVSHG